jgi:hypothetical protein
VYWHSFLCRDAVIEAVVTLATLRAPSLAPMLPIVNRQLFPTIKIVG